MKFTKMHSLGNDYVYIDMFTETIDDPKRWAKFLSHRRYGVGGDGIVLIGSSDVADFSMRIFNVDGTEAEMCGNALRSVGKYVYQKKYTHNNIFTVSTLGGIKTVSVIEDGNTVRIKADIGEPILDHSLIPCTQTLVDHPYTVKDRTFYINSISMGNPHCVTFVDDLDNFDINIYGAAFEVNRFYPNRTNVEFVQLIDRNTLKMRVWERGCGETWACGTGCSAAAVISILHNYTDRKLNIIQKGGTLHIEWNEETNSILMESDAEIVFSGEVTEDSLHNFERMINDEA